MAQQQAVTNPRIAKLIELEVAGRIKPEHQQELNTYRSMGVAPKNPVGTPTVEQGKAGSFYHRATGSNEDYEGTAGGAGAGPRSIPRQWLHDSFPNIENSWFNDVDRQKADAAQRDFIAATLRYESGAAIPPSEFENQYASTSPCPEISPAFSSRKRRLGAGRSKGCESAQARPRRAAIGCALRAKVTSASRARCRQSRSSS